MEGMRTIFVVLAPAGASPTAMSHNMPVDQRLTEVLQMMLALPGAFKSQGDWGSIDTYRLEDLYGQDLDPNLLVRQVPFPGCVIAVSKGGAVKVGEQTVRGDEAAAMVARSIAMNLLAQKEDEEDPLARRYARYIKSGAWRYEPTPVTGLDVGLSYHDTDSGAGALLLEMLRAKGLRCRARVVNRDGSSSGLAESHSPAEDARALVVMISPQTQHDPWVAYDIGVAWASGIPVVPVLIGKWDAEPPNILAPYQRLNWETQRERLVTELVELLDLTPWSLPAVADGAEPAVPPPPVQDVKPRTGTAAAKQSSRPSKAKRQK